MTFDNMVFDREQADVDNALQIRAEKVQTFQELTASEAETLERGMLTVDTINRIEQMQAELKTLLNGMGYWNTPVTNNFIKGHSLQYGDVFYKKDLQQIIDNENILRNAFFTYSDTPNTPGTLYDYESINSIEKIIYDLSVMIEYVKNNYRQCGTLECGEE